MAAESEKRGIPVVAGREEFGPCVKCRGAEIRVRFVERREDWTYAFNSSDDHAVEEHLRLTCERCLYAWNQPPADAPTETPAVTSIESVEEVVARYGGRPSTKEEQDRRVRREELRARTSREADK